MLSWDNYPVITTVIFVTGPLARQIKFSKLSFSLWIINKPKGWMLEASHRKSTSIYNSAGAFSQYISFPQAEKLMLLTIVDWTRKVSVQSLGALDDSEWVQSWYGGCTIFTGSGSISGAGGMRVVWGLGRIPALLRPHPPPFTLFPPHCLIVLEMLVTFFHGSDSWSRSRCLGKLRAPGKTTRTRQNNLVKPRKWKKIKVKFKSVLSKHDCTGTLGKTRKCPK